MKTIARRSIQLLGAALLSGGLAACASTRPSQELVDARSAYNLAANSNARQLAPDRLFVAQQSLEQAERMHKDEPGSLEERSWAYVAQRQAQQAVAFAGIEEAKNNQSKAEATYREVQEQSRRTAQSDLSTTQEELEAVRRELAEQGENLTERTQMLQQRERELAARQQELQAQGSELEQERRARMEAEQRAQAALESLEQIANVREDARGTVITLSGAVLFTTGQADLMPIARQRLNAVADALKAQDTNRGIVIYGHTDSRGGKQLNAELSKRRAESVKEYLVSRGVEPQRVETIGMGPDEPVASNDTAEGRANNRRVEIVIEKTEQTQQPSPGQKGQSPGQQSPGQQSPGQQSPSQQPPTR